MHHPSEKILFPNYTQISSIVPLYLWKILRALSICVAISLVVTLFIYPKTGLFLLWKIAVPLLPLIFLILPGLWRNVCPLAALNQTPRIFGFTKGLAHTDRIKEYSFVIGIVLFFVLVTLRKIVFNDSGTASALLILFALVFAFLGGLIYKGKSGWCSSICPLLPVQRLYGQTPFITLPNSHCQPCVGCTKNCYDFNPSVAYLADQYDDDKQYTGYRRFFAAALPGFILAYFLVPPFPQSTLVALLFHTSTLLIVSIGIFFFLETFAKVSANKLTALFGACAFSVYYWFSLPILLSSVQHIFNAPIPSPILWVLRSLLGGAICIWLYRTYMTEKKFIAQAIAANVSQSVKIGAGANESFKKMGQKEQATITFVPDQKTIASEHGRSILELTESCGLSIESGCRMGICGADPVAVVEGFENLSAIGDSEKATLERLGLADNTRMACCARIRGNAKVSLTPDKKTGAAKIQNSNFDESIKNVVILGNGIAGVTAADHVRRLHPECNIHLISREKMHLYNRMGISRLIYGRSAMQGLYLLPDTWYDEQKISCWINTHVSAIDIHTHKVELATGDLLEYDKLIIATGSSSYIPNIEGYGALGTFSLREAEDALSIRDFAQRHHCKKAVIAGGGLLGLEAAYALHKLGLHVTVLERGKWPLQRQLNLKGGIVLKEYLVGLGLNILVESETKIIKSSTDKRVNNIVLQNGTELPCDLFLMCAGVQPNISLAKAAGIATHKGIIVDACMQTSIESIYAVGDAAEFKSQNYGLWPVAVDQAEIAAINAMGGHKEYTGFVPATMLKVVGAEVSSIGALEMTTPTDTIIELEEPSHNKYRRLIISENKIVGAILIGYPTDGPLVTKAIKEKRDVSPVLLDLKNGNWQVLESL